MKVRTISPPVGQKSAKHFAKLQSESESLTTKIETKATLKDDDISEELPGLTAFKETFNALQAGLQLSHGDMKEQRSVYLSATSSYQKPYKESGGLQHRPSKRASQVLQSTGFPIDIANDGRRRTVLQSSVLVLMDDQGSIPFNSNAQRSLPEATSGQLVSTQKSIKKERSLKKAVTKQMDMHSSFRLSDYDNLENMFKQKLSFSDKTLLIFSEDSFIRRFACKLVMNIWYLRFTLLWVAISIFVLVETDPMGDPLVLPSVVPFFDKAILAVFAADLIVKLIAHGLFLTSDPYLGNPYNLVDLFNLIVDGIHLIPMNAYSKRASRVLLAFRPLRLISRSEGMRDLFTNLIESFPAVFSVFIFTFSVFGIFAVVGTQMFRGLFTSCNDGSSANRAQCVGYYVNQVSILAPRVWANPPFHFDDFGNAMLSLFVCSTFDNWLDNWLYIAMDITHRDTQPSRNSSPMYAFYFVIFVCVGGFFVLRMFVGVLIDEFGVHSGSKLLTERQKLWRDMNRIIQKMKPTRQVQEPTGWLRHKCYSLVHSNKYSNCMILIIVANYIFLATHKDGESIAVSLTRKKIQCGFVAIYLMEAIINFLGSEIRDFFVDPSVVFEAFLSITGAACLFPKPNSPRQIVGRLVYTTRIFCIVRHIPRAKTLMHILYVCLPSMIDIMGLLMVFLFVYAGIGVQIFAHVKDGICLGPWINFHSFYNSFVAVFQVTTADNWSCIMYDAMVERPFCTPTHIFERDDCGYPVASPIYFVSLIVVSSHIFMNLFVAIILDSITFGLVKENAMVTPDNLYHFQKLWGYKDFDPRCTGYIGLHKLRSFIKCLGRPLGYRHKDPIVWYTRIEYEVLHFHVPYKGVPFKHLLETLTLYKIGPTGLPLSLRIEREKQIQQLYECGAAIKIQSATRGFLARRRQLQVKFIKRGSLMIE